MRYLLIFLLIGCRTLCTELKKIPVQPKVMYAIYQNNCIARCFDFINYTTLPLSLCFPDEKNNEEDSMFVDPINCSEIIGFTPDTWALFIGPTIKRVHNLKDAFCAMTKSTSKEVD